jgi:hypothetical protein
MTTVEQWVSLTDTTYENPYVEGVRQLAFTGVQEGKLSREQAAWLIEKARSYTAAKNVTLSDLGDLGVHPCQYCQDNVIFVDSEWHSRRSGPLCPAAPTHEPKDFFPDGSPKGPDNQGWVQ